MSDFCGSSTNNFLNEINNLKTEIERLKKSLDGLTRENSRLLHENTEYDKRRREAIDVWEEHRFKAQKMSVDIKSEDGIDSDLDLTDFDIAESIVMMIKSTYNMFIKCQNKK